MTNNYIQISELNQNYNIKYAGMWVRLLAFFLDTLLCGLLITVLFLLYGLEISMKSISTMPTWLYVASLLIQLIYPIILVSSKWQATLGMKFLGIKIVDSFGEKISFWRSAARVTIMLFPTWVTLFDTTISFLYIIACIPFIFIAFDECKRAFYDYICGTYVIYEESRSNKESRSNTEVVYSLASLWRRLGASIIDLLFLIFILIIMQFFFLKDINISYENLFYCLITIYSIYFPITKQQATLGMQCLGIKIIDIKGERISFFHSLLRFTAFALIGIVSIKSAVVGLLADFPILALLPISSLLVILFREDKRALHDLIAKTYVVYLKKE